MGFVSDALSSIPIVGGLFGGGGGGSSAPQQNPNMGQALGSAPMPSPNYPGYGPQAFPGWPVPAPMSTPQAPKFNGNLADPGAAESYFSQNMSRFTGAGPGQQYAGNAADKLGQKGSGQDYWQGVQGAFNAPKAVAQNAQGAYNQFQNSTPADTSSYYNQAVTNANKDVNNQMAARGMYNSSAATNQLATTDANIRAQQAKDEADYGLQRAGLGGSLASAADTSSRGASQDMLSWLGTGGQLANQLQNLNTNQFMNLGQMGLAMNQGALSGLNSGMNAAQGAQQALAQRGQNYFNNTMGLSQANAGGLTGIYGQGLQNDQQLQDQQIATMLGLNQNDLTQSLNDRASTEQGIGNFFGLVGDISGAGGMGKMMKGLA